MRDIFHLIAMVGMELMSKSVLRDTANLFVINAFLPFVFEGKYVFLVEAH
jgi:hypothetical protein